MAEFLNKFSGGELIGLVAVIVGPIIAIISVIATQWRRVRITEMEACLKQQMLDKGMSAEQIEQVMNASLEAGAKPISLTGNASLDKAALAQKMVEEGYEGADIERVLQAYQSPPREPQEHGQR